VAQSDDHSITSSKLLYNTVRSLKPKNHLAQRLSFGPSDGFGLPVRTMTYSTVRRSVHTSLHSHREHYILSIWALATIATSSSPFILPATSLLHFSGHLPSPPIRMISIDWTPEGKHTTPPDRAVRLGCFAHLWGHSPHSMVSQLDLLS
jgi:hypothetical protein